MKEKYDFSYDKPMAPRGKYMEMFVRKWRMLLCVACGNGSFDVK